MARRRGLGLQIQACRTAFRDNSIGKSMRLLNMRASGLCSGHEDHKSPSPSLHPRLRERSSATENANKSEFQRR